ncbi:MAG: NAD(P)-binding domain-containing protein [Bdellovibrionaceae bacterium]|jgi:thioredoxin reductase (NADPH)|nr:NAD(P)-binding domain-containing protein [Pseudobdellovibrionaceae bacterium]
MFDLIVIGAGPAGISMAAEAISSGVASNKVLVLEKAKEHSFTIRKFYPESKEVTANYKGAAAVCYGVMCIDDTSKIDALSYLDKAISDHNITVNYGCGVTQIKKEDDTFLIETSCGVLKAKVCVIAIGIFGRPNKPDYKIPSSIKKKIHYDVNSDELRNSSILVVGGGDSASEYAQYLVQENAKVFFSYRQPEFKRMNPINNKSLLELGNQNKVQLILSSNVDELALDESKVKITFKEDNIEAVSVDHIVYALGGTTPANFLKYIGIEYIGDQPQLTEDHETSIKGLFLVGDLASGKKGGSIISAFNSSREALHKICTDYLNCKI